MNYTFVSTKPFTKTLHCSFSWHSTIATRSSIAPSLHVLLNLFSRVTEGIPLPFYSQPLSRLLFQSTMHTGNKCHGILCIHACSWQKNKVKKKSDVETKLKLYSTHQFFSACFQFHISMFLHPVCMQICLASVQCNR